MIKTIILGIIQGLTEFLPVSSSGHLVLSQHFLNKHISNENISLEVFLHLGSLLAVLIYYRKDILTLFYSLFKWNKTKETQNNHRIILFLIISTVATGIIGISFKESFEHLFNQPILVSIFLFITGIILIFSDKLKHTVKRIEELNYKKSVLIGLGQAIAILPGISRSGTTIVFSIFAGLKREEAAKFSFLLSIPAILGANILEFNNILNLDSSLLITYCIGLLSALISGLLVIKLLLKLINNSKLKYFAYYCFAVSGLSMILLLLGF